MSSLYGLAGVAFSGKDATASSLESELGFKRTYMSEPLERALLALNPIVWVPRHPGRELGLVRWWGRHLRYVDIHRAVGYDASKRIPEVRTLLQRLGTEVGRNIIGETVWLDVAERRVKEWLADGHNVVITGIRFANEANMVRSHGGEVVWVERGLAPVNGHVSDHGLTEGDCDWTLPNHGTLADLRLNVLDAFGGCC